MIIAASGFVGLGTRFPDQKLTVKGNIHAQEVKVDLAVPGPDYVFEKDYDLSPLEEVEKYIRSNKHLEGVPAAKTMQDEGINLGKMQMKLLEKIEELTLYVIDLKKQNDKLALENAKQQEQINGMLVK